MDVRVLLLGVLCCMQSANAQTYSVKAEVYFENFENVVVSEIERAKEKVFVHIFKFNSEKIAQALIDAQKRGIEVSVMIDGKAARDKRNRARQLSEAGVPTFIDSEHATMHNKITIIDGNRVVTGSYNYTKKADRKNAENILVLTDVALRDRYFENWLAHRAHSLVYEDFKKIVVAK